LHSKRTGHIKASGVLPTKWNPPPYSLLLLAAAEYVWTRKLSFSGKKNEPPFLKSREIRLPTPNDKLINQLF